MIGICYNNDIQHIKKKFMFRIKYIKNLTKFTREDNSKKNQLK
jgi:hypothetical protein